MEDLTNRINEALAREEERAERFASSARLTLLALLTVIAILNAASLTLEANVMNFGALAVGYGYGLAVLVRIRRRKYRPVMKYLTSCIDIALVFLLLFLYSRIEIPSVALKNYVFLIIFPLIGLTVFRYDVRLTLVAGGTAIVLYLALILDLSLTGAISITNGGYDRELFTTEVTMVGQATKILILAAYVALVAYLARYSRRLFERLVRQEIDVQSQKDSMVRELEIAGHVQSQLLPHAFPDLGALHVFGMVEQGRFVGGDYCDFLRLSDHRMLVVVADVSGKGVPAALIMSEVRASTHLLASAELDLADFVQRLNGLLLKSTDRKTFVTLFAGEIDTSTRVIRYVNAGHPPPLMFRDRHLSSLLKGTIPLGVMARVPQLSLLSEPFPPGSMVVCYTDGIFERRNQEGEEYGEERLKEFTQSHIGLDSQAFAHRLLEEVKAFGQGKDLDDDITVAVAKWLAE
jgi:serine phosphatase RsbU (regulator of sigma subunit)